MRIQDFDFDLPRELIAQQPAGQRDESRLLVIDRSTGSFRHRIFRDLPEYFTKQDLLVVNDSRVFPARLFAHRPGHSESIEILLVQELGPETWQVLSRPARKLKPGTRLVFKTASLEAEVRDVLPKSPVRTIRFSTENDFWEQIEALGTMPLPPYIQRSNKRATDDQQLQADRLRYQTIYARDRGSIAAPTAGLHFTKKLLNRFDYCFVTLHVGYGTFKPVTSERVESHSVDPETYSVDAFTAQKIQTKKETGGKIVAVGSTTTRTLETIAGKYGRIIEARGTTELFIYPGFRFKAVDCLLTNFHLPRSSLILLAAAFAGKELLLEAYCEAIREKYRFYSYGDAMLIL